MLLSFLFLQCELVIFEFLFFFQIVFYPIHPIADYKLTRYLFQKLDLKQNILAKHFAGLKFFDIELIDLSR